MIGLVIVSHSAALAEGVVELARGMGGPDLPIAAAGGLDLPGHPMGTDPMRVLAAIEQVYSPDGVLVLMDLGSAVLSAEMALDMLTSEKQARVLLCAAPLVEGAVAAAVQARLGDPLERVLAEALGGLAGKAAQLAPGAEAPPQWQPGQARLEEPPEIEAINSPARPPSGVQAAGAPFHAAEPAEGAAPTAGNRQRGETAELRLTVSDPLGLHARPAARLVQTASRYKRTKIQAADLTTGRGPVSATSITALSTLGARQGHLLLFTAAGPEAAAALRALAEALALANNTGPVVTGLIAAEDRTAPAGRGGQTRPPPGSESDGLHGLPASPGIAIGPLHQLHPAFSMAPQSAAADPPAEWDALQTALEETRQQIRLTRQMTAERLSEDAAVIFEAHLLYLEDDALLGPAHADIFDAHLSASAAWQAAVHQVAAAYRALEDPYLQGRARDVEEVGQQVLARLQLGTAPQQAPKRVGASGTPGNRPGILVAPDLTLAEAARLDPDRIRGVCTAYGSPTSHCAILLRGLGIPAVFGLGEAILNWPEAALLLIDGETGQVWPDPQAEQVAEYTRRMEEITGSAQSPPRQAANQAPAHTRDGRRVEIVANIGSVAEARAAVTAGAEGVGVLRTEFLFLDRLSAPDEEEQAAAYRAIAAALEGRPLIIRTLDAGGDKTLPYLAQTGEANPFLGWRAIRMCLAQPEFFKTQLRAVLRTAAEFPVKVMFPMVATLSEWRAAASLLAQAAQEVQSRGGRRPLAPRRIEAGIMVEIPSAALCADRFAPEVDFFSIGTNDLTQYTLAAERGNPRLVGLSDPFHPAVLALIQKVVQAAHANGKWVGVCGEMAGDPLAAALLVGLGVDELSMNGPSIPRIQEIVRGLNAASLAGPAAGLLSLESAEAVRESAARLSNPEH